MYIKSHRKKGGLLGLILRSGRELRPKLIGLSSCSLVRHRCKILFYIKRGDIHGYKVASKYLRKIYKHFIWWYILL
jgi:hypothetical protein